jgi:tRNA-dihydrouridine synthase A
MLHRLMAPHAWLYTEMMTAGALLHGPRERLLAFDPAEHPVAVQLGGSEPDELARCAGIAAAVGYDEINLNVGCPSARVQDGRIGACLMREPGRVALAVERMGRAVEVPVTVKCRLGVDDDDDYAFLRNFVTTVADAGCRTFVIHARKAILHGLTPVQNRSVPPLDYARVLRLKRDFPDLEIIVNGGITNVVAASPLLAEVDGVMIGRAAYHDPWLLTRLEHLLWGTPPPASRHSVIERYLPYVEAQLVAGARLHDLTRHMLGLFNGMPGARRFRRTLSDQAARRGAGPELIRQAAAMVSERLEALETPVCMNA